MSDRAPDNSQPSLYLHWLCSLSEQEHTEAYLQATALAYPLADLVGSLRQMHPEIPVGIWLNALGRVWQGLEQELSLPKETTPHE